MFVEDSKIDKIARPKVVSKKQHLQSMSKERKEYAFFLHMAQIFNICHVTPSGPNLESSTINGPPRVINVTKILGDNLVWSGRGKH